MKSKSLKTIEDVRAWKRAWDAQIIAQIPAEYQDAERAAREHWFERDIAIIASRNGIKVK